MKINNIRFIMSVRLNLIEEVVMVSFLLKSTLVLLLLVGVNSYAQNEPIVYLPSDASEEPSKGWGMPIVEIPILELAAPAVPTHVNATDAGCGVTVTWDSMRYAASIKCGGFQSLLYGRLIRSLTL